MLNTKKIFIFCLIFIIIIGLITGCGNGKNQNTDEAVDINEVEEIDIVYYAFPSAPILNWDPSEMFSDGVVVLSNVYETLLRYEPKTQSFNYVLAESYEMSEDGLTWTFKVREGVKFHDGTDFNAEAVKFSIERTIEKGLGSAYIWDPVESIEVIDEYTVVFNLKYVAPLDLIAASSYAAYIMSPSVADKPDGWFEQGNEAGTGPYMLESSSMGDEVVLSKFDDYWKGWDGEHFEKAIIKHIPETSSRRQLIEMGEADIVKQLPSEDIEALKGNSNVKINVEQSLMDFVGAINVLKEPFDNPKVRQALAYAFPYEDCIKYAAGGYAVQSKGAIPVGNYGHGENLFQYTHDLDKAKALLEEAGIKEGELSIVLTYCSGDEDQKKSAELYKVELSKIGVELEIRAMPWESQWEMAQSNNIEDRQDIFFTYNWPSIVNPYSWLSIMFYSEEDVLFNLSYYYDSEFDSMIDNAYINSVLDNKKAEQEFIDAQEKLIEDCAALFIYDKQEVTITNSTLKGFIDNPAYNQTVFFYDVYREK